MKNSTKNNISKILYFILLTVFLWLSISNIIQAFNCPEMTNTELFLHLPKSFICDWTSCN